MRIIFSSVHPKIFSGKSPGCFQLIPQLTEMPFNDDQLDELIRSLFASGPVEHDFSPSLLVELFSRSQDSLAQLPTVVDLNGPLFICGDIHGQYADLLAIFEECGWPFNTRYLFLGDYVDRGHHSLEVLVLLTVLQLRFPNNIYLLRGNHESPSVNITYGFLSELRARYQTKEDHDLIFEHICKMYSQLPVAALVCQSMLALHGGLSPSLNSIQELRELKRGQQEPTGLLEDLLWSDPSPGCGGFQPNDDRGCSYSKVFTSVFFTILR